MKDRRTTRRYDLSLPIIILATNDENAASCTGMTRDISNRGVYFTISDDLRAGAKLNLTMILLPEAAGHTEVFIRATGKVIRVDNRPGNGNQNIDVAAAFEKYEIVRSVAPAA